MTTNSLLRGLLLAGIIVLVAALTVPLFPKHKAPLIEFTTITGNSITMASLKGRPVIVSFWSTQCPSCILDMPHLIKLYQDYHAEGLEMIAVTVPYDMPSRVLAIVNAKRLPYPVALDPQGVLSAAFGEIKATPTNFLVDPDGNIVTRKIGQLDMDKLRPMLDEILTNQQS